MGLPVILKSPEPGFESYATVNGSPSRLPQIDCENLLKAQEDLDNATYWSLDGITVTEPETGVWRMTKTAATWKTSVQAMQNWLPAWVGAISVIVELRAGDLDEFALIGKMDGSTNTGISGEVISGNATINDPTGDYLHVSNLDSGWSKVRFTWDAKGWSSAAVLMVGPDPLNSTAGYVDTRNWQVVLGDEEKPRPTNVNNDDWMMAWRPHNRATNYNSGAEFGACRYSVTDTDGLVSIGECQDIKVSPASTSTFNHPADFEAEVIVTQETGKDVTVQFDREDNNNRLYVRLSTSDTLVISDEVATVDTILYNAAITPGEVYRIRIRRAGTLCSAWLDDELIVDEATVAADRGYFGYVYTDYATNDLKIVTETYPRRATEIIIAGGKATPAYGDPGLWLTDINGSAFSVGAGSAAMWTAKTFMLSRYTNFGFDANTSSNVGTNFFEMRADQLRVDPGNMTPQAWALGETKSFIQMYRSDTHGSQFLLHEDGKRWKRINVYDGVVNASPAYPCITGYNAPLTVSNFALLDLSSKHDEEFVGVTDSKSAPASNTSVALDADHHFNCTFTFETGKYVGIYGRRVGATDFGWRVLAATDGALQIHEGNAGLSSLYQSASGYFSDGVSYELDVVVEGTSLKLFIDKVLVRSETLQYYSTTEAGFVIHSLATNDIVLTTHPHPALGGNLGATDRGIYPTGNYVMDPTSAMLIGRGVVLASIPVDFHRDTTTGQRVRNLIDSTGRMRLQNYTGDTINSNIVDTVSTGHISDDDTETVILDEGYGELFSNGVSKGSNTNAYQPNEPKSLIKGTCWDSYEFWPLYAKLPFKL